MNFRIRPCTVDDLEVLRDMAVQIFSETFSPLNTPENMDAYMQSAYNLPKLRQELLDKNQEFYFVYADDALAGYMKVNEAPSQSELNDPDALELERLYVHKAFLGAGVGQFLMEKATEMASERKKAYIFLGVWEYNARARRFYQKNGFYRFGAHTFVMGDDPQTDYLMRKNIE